MSMWGGIGGALQNIGGNMMQMAFSDMQDKKIEARKKQEQEAMRLLEEARVARTQPYKSPADPKAQSPWISKEAGGYVTPQGKPEQWMVEEFNSQGKPIGSRPASMSEDQQYRSADELAKQKALADAGDLAWKQEERGMKQTKAELDLRKGEQSIRTSKASEQYMRSGGGRNATPKAKDPDKVMNDIQTLLRYPENIAAIEAVDPTLLKRIQGGGTSGIDNAIKSGLAYFGAKPQEADGSLWSELEAAGDDELRAQILYGVKRELDAALARGRAGKKGMKPEAGGNSFVANGGLDNKGQ